MSFDAGAVAAVFGRSTLFGKRLGHCSRMPCRSVSKGSRLASSTVFGARPSIVAPTASANFLTTVLHSPGGSAPASPRSTSFAGFLPVPALALNQKLQRRIVQLKLIADEGHRFQTLPRVKLPPRPELPMIRRSASLHLSGWVCVPGRGRRDCMPLTIRIIDEP
jgi:hypothetical protein